MGIKLLPDSYSIYRDKDYKLFLTILTILRLSSCQISDMVATPTVVTEMGQSPLLVPKAKRQVMFGSTDPKFPSFPAPGSGLVCPAVGNWPQWVSPANHAQAITSGALVSAGYG